MGELPNNIPEMKCVWNKNKIIPPTSNYTISINIETSVDIDSIKQWLSGTLTETFQTIAQQTNAKEELISIETTKL